MPTDLASSRFVPDGFAVPRGLEHALFVLRPLDVEHNERDYAAWTTSLDHIASTPGFVGTDWPHPMRLDENRHDLERHAADFAARRGFTYTVLDGDDVIGCVYIYPVGTDDADRASDPIENDASVRSWVSVAHAPLDRPLWEAVTEWLREVWPFERVAYAPRS